MQFIWFTKTNLKSDVKLVQLWEVKKMKGSKVLCGCGATITIPFAAKKPLDIPSSETEAAPSAQIERVKCPYCGFEFRVIPYTVEEFCGVPDPHCHNCGKVLDENDDIVVLHTHEDAKPAEYELEASLAPDKLYRRVREAEPEKDHRYFFCSQDCYSYYLKKFGFDFKGTFVKKEV